MWTCDNCEIPEPFNVLCPACEELVCLDCGRVHCCCDPNEKTMHNYEDFYIVGTSNNLIFIGNISVPELDEDELDDNALENMPPVADIVLTDYCQLGFGQNGMIISDPMFPSSRIVIPTPSFIIKIADMDKRERNATCDSLRQHFAKKTSGLILAKT